MIYSTFVVTDYNNKGEKKIPEKLMREQFHLNILANTQYVYPIEVPSMIDSFLSECVLYRVSKTANVMIIPNCGYVFGGILQAEAPYVRGLDCTSFVGWISGCGRPLTFLYEVAWNLKMGKPPG